jgi:DNA replication protein DnaC
VDRSTPRGKRDFAILLLAARYGLRASDIRCLRFENIRWRRPDCSHTIEDTTAARTSAATRDGFTALYFRAPRLFRDLSVARADGSFGKLLDRFARIDVLIVDDWAMAPLADSERRDFLEICDDRYSIRSTVLTSQVLISHWHDQIGDPTLADSILDRLVHNAHRIELAGASIRKSKNGKSSPDGGDEK